jgi:hypothetical protein
MRGYLFRALSKDMTCDELAISPRAARAKLTVLGRAYEAASHCYPYNPSERLGTGAEVQTQ